MAGGLFALLDDVALIARTAASSLDDVAAGAAKASAKSAGVIIDDAAITPSYVTNISADRELGIIGRIARGSLFNKFVIIIPLALLLSQFAEWALPILLVAGGTFLVYEGAHKVAGWLGLGHHEHQPTTATAPLTGEPPDADTVEQAEDKVVFGAVRTDLILSAEIMLISLANMDTDSFWLRTGMLIAVALIMTLLVYGSVAVLVRMDDWGMRLAERSETWAKRFGRCLVTAMPKILGLLSVVGTVAMLWVGGHLLLANGATLGFHAPYDLVHYLEEAVHSFGGVAVWLVDTACSAVAGLLVGGLVVACTALVGKLIPGRKSHS